MGFDVTSVKALCITHIDESAQKSYNYTANSNLTSVTLQLVLSIH